MVEARRGGYDGLFDSGGTTECNKVCNFKKDWIAEVHMQSMECLNSCIWYVDRRVKACGLFAITS
jgi:hypothetical protein